MKFSGYFWKVLCFPLVNALHKTTMDSLILEEEFCTNNDQSDELITYSSFLKYQMENSSGDQHLVLLGIRPMINQLCSKMARFLVFQALNEIKNEEKGSTRKTFQNTSLQVVDKIAVSKFFEQLSAKHLIYSTMEVIDSVCISLCIYATEMRCTHCRSSFLKQVCKRDFLNAINNPKLSELYGWWKSFILTDSKDLKPWKELFEAMQTLEKAERQSRIEFSLRLYDQYDEMEGNECKLCLYEGLCERNDSIVNQMSFPYYSDGKPLFGVNLVEVSGKRFNLGHVFKKSISKFFRSANNLWGKSKLNVKT